MQGKRSKKKIVFLQKLKDFIQVSGSGKQFFYQFYFRRFCTPDMAVVIIPAYQPDEMLISLIDKLWTLGCRIVVVDDGSGEKYITQG